MKKYRKAIMFIVVAVIPALFFRNQFGGFLSALLLFCVCLDVVVQKWGHLTLRQIAPRKTALRVCAGVCFIGVGFFPLWMNSRSYMLGLLTSLVIIFGLGFGLAGIGIALMKEG